MLQSCLPEGRLLHTEENAALCSSLPALRTAMEEQTVLEGKALFCTPDHDLMVSVGPFSGRIPRTECALGIREGTTKEIAILSRVGKPVAFTVTDWNPEGELILSRRRAQEMALSHRMNCPVGTVLPATVTHLDGFGAFVDLGWGVPSMIGIDRCSVARISHASCRFRVGQEIFVLLTGVDREKGRLYLSHKELLGTWRENASNFSAGMTVPGYVRGKKDYGVFVELTPNLTGLADPTDGVSEGDRVAVYIRSIQPEKRKIKLNLLHTLDPLPEPPPLSYFISSGRVEHWVYYP